MVEVAIYAAATGGALLVGAALGCFRTPPKRLTAGMLAFAAGALIVAVAFELFEPAHRQAGLPRASAALLVGAATFIAVDLVLQRHAGAQAGGLALVAAATLDGVPETSLSASASPGAAPTRSSRRSSSRTPARGVRRRGPDACGRSILGTRPLGVGRDRRAPRRRSRLGQDRRGPRIRGAAGHATTFAAGAVRAALADTVMPEAYAEGGPLVAFATIGGFLLAYALTTLD